MTADPTTGSVGPAIPIRLRRDKQARTEAIAAEQNVTRAEAIRRLVDIGIGQYDREMAPNRSATDGLADALDEVASRVAEQFGAARLAAWQTVMSWVISRSTVDFDRLTGEHISETFATDADA